MRALALPFALGLSLLISVGCSSSSGSGAGSGGTGGGGSGNACADYADAVCSLVSSCSKAIEGMNGGADTCRSDLQAECEWWKSLPDSGATDAALEACAAYDKPGGCALLEDWYVPACTFAGKVKTGGTCVDNVQCASDSCVIDPDTWCGTCDPPPNLGAACTTSDDCDDPLVCDAGKCAEPQQAGHACDGNHLCSGGLICINGKCGVGTKQPGDACSDYGDCDPATGMCNAGQCYAWPATANLGDPCQVDTSCLGGTTCTNGVCAQRPKLGDACNDKNGDTLDCVPPATCISGTCKVPDPKGCP